MQSTDQPTRMIWIHHQSGVDRVESWPEEETGVSVEEQVAYLRSVSPPDWKIELVSVEPTLAGEPDSTEAGSVDASC